MTAFVLCNIQNWLSGQIASDEFGLAKMPLALIDAATTVRFQETG